MSAAELLPQPLWRYQFFSALRALELRMEGCPRLGEQGPARAEQIRLRPSTSFLFPTTEVADLEWRPPSAAGPRVVVTTNLPGLYGVGSPLPRTYAHQILQEDDEVPQTREFLDLLHHRLLSLWYRAWKRHHYEQSFEREGLDELTRILFELIGVPKDATEEMIGTPPIRLLRYLGWFVLRARPVNGLAILLREELALPLEIEQLPVRWLTVRPELQSRLRCDPQRGGRLGHDFVLGARRMDRAGALRLQIGPVSYKTLLDLWPGAPLHLRLTALARFYLRQPLDLQLHVRVPAAEVQRARLSTHQPTRLGWPCSSGTPRQDPVEVVIPASLAIHPDRNRPPS